MKNILNNQVHTYLIDEYSTDPIYEFLKKSSCFDIIVPGDTVVLKPNWVRESHLENDDWDYVITHPTVIEAAFKLVIEKLRGKGEVIIADGPQTDSSFKKIVQHMNIDYWYELGKKNGIKLTILDLRDEEWISKDGVILRRIKLDGDPKGSVDVNFLGENSEFYGHIKSKRGYFGASPDIEEVNKAHDGNNNKYRVSRTVIDADVFINLPKLKTHKKSGITCCLKNLVGINTYKNFLPHHTEGTPEENGDQYPDSSRKRKIEGFLLSKFKKIIKIKKNNILIGELLRVIRKSGEKAFGSTSKSLRNGSWYGNDTLWRTIIDLNKVLLYANTNNTLKEDNWVNTKKYIGVVDGIKGGEGCGPMAPDLINSNMIIVGKNPLIIDCVCAKLIGFDYKKIPSLINAFKIKRYKIFDGSYDDIDVISNKFEFNKKLKDIDKKDVLNFKPHIGWKGNIELNE